MLEKIPLQFLFRHVCWWRGDRGFCLTTYFSTLASITYRRLVAHCIEAFETIAIALKTSAPKRESALDSANSLIFTSAKIGPENSPSQRPGEARSHPRVPVTPEVPPIFFQSPTLKPPGAGGQRLGAKRCFSVCPFFSLLRSGRVSFALEFSITRLL